MIWPVTAKFRQAITRHPILTSVVTCTPPGTGQPAVKLPLVSGTWTVQSGQLIRRTAPIVIDGGSTMFDLVSTPGAVFRITHGINYGSSVERVPIIAGELSSAATTLGDGTISLGIADFGQRIQGCSYLTAVSPATTTLRTAAIASAVTDVVSTTVTTTASDTGTIGVAQTWTDRAQLITDLATDGNAEAFFQPDGTFLIRNVPQITDPAAYSITTGADGTLETLTRSRPLDKLFNTVIVVPSSLDSSQTWTQVVVQVTDTSSPVHPSKIGVRPYTWTAPTIMSAAEATAAGQVILSQVDGVAESLQLGVLSLAALDAGDVVTILNPIDGGQYRTDTHIIDSLTGDLITGHMDLATRSATALAA